MMAKVIPLKDDPNTDIETAVCKKKKSFRSKGERMMSKNKYRAFQTRNLQGAAEEC